jgi:hypothetical protein
MAGIDPAALQQVISLLNDIRVPDNSVQQAVLAVRVDS